ncbi:MAG: VCBS repeat-containing protein [Acidobacteriota bacterium]
MKTISIAGLRLISRSFGAQLLAMTLITALAAPAFAVVFTNPASITVNDAAAIGMGNPYPAPIAVSGLTGTVTNVTISLNTLNHTFPDDWDVLLVAPGGENLIVMSDVGGSTDITNTSFTLDDAAATSLPDATVLQNGTFKPTNIGAGDTFPAPAPAPSANTTFAASFNGANSTGIWNLFLVDDLGADMGVIGNGWSITITTTSSPATTFTNGAAIHGGDGGRARATPYASTISATGLTGAITDVNVTLTNINHLNPDDLDIMLVGPSGKRILLLSDAGGTTDVITQTLTFDDAAAAGVPDAGPLVTATVKPTNFGTGDTLPDLLPPYPNSATAGTATLASVFNGTEGNGTWRLFIVDDANTSAGDVAGGWSIDITAGGTYGAKRFTSSDFGGDGETDVSIYRPSDSNWWLRSSSAYANSVTKWGTTSDVPVPSDYDGDGKTDLAVFRPSSGTWIVVNSATSSVSFTAWGNSTDTVVPADYDADGKIDVAIWRNATGTFWVRQSSNSATRILKWGISGDLPVRGHFEGTDGADFAVFRPSDGNWYILNNAANSSRQIQWGLSTDRPVQADYDGDGKTDVAVFRPSEGNWYVLQSLTASASILHWGQNGDTPVPGDYDGDSKADVAVARLSSGDTRWYILNSGTPTPAAALREDSWGLSTDIALPATYLP